jgi:hypothetical protein
MQPTLQLHLEALGMASLISEAITPLPGSFDPSAMSQGLPGLPSGFRWRGKSFRIASCRRTWSKLGAGDGGAGLYRRRHYFDLLMDDETQWVVYLTRRAQSSSRTRERWFLYTIS